MPTLDQLDAAMLQPGQFVPAIQQAGGGTVTLTDDGHPWREVGNDAAVYQLTAADGRILALRCPLEDTLAARITDIYPALARGGGVAVHSISDMLARPIALMPQGLSIPGDEFRSSTHGVIVMEWIEGETLLQVAERACSADDRSALAALAASWQEAVERLQKARFIHGDLSDQNILVDPGGRIRLVDLDSCAWPGSPAPPVRFGTAGYVHPRATPETTGANRDAFAALVISVSLAALARSPRLRRPTRQQGGLLFSTWDLAHLRTSPVFNDLLGLAGPGLREASEALLRACEGKPNDVQSHAERANRGLHAARQAMESDPTPEEDASDQTRIRDVERFRERWQSSGRPRVSRSEESEIDPRRRADDVQRLKDAIGAGEEDRVAALWPKVRGDARLSAHAITIADILQRFHGKAVAEALRGGNDEHLIDSGREAEAAGVAVTASTRRALRQARRNIALRQRVRQALEGDDPRLLAELHASPEVQEIIVEGDASKLTEQAGRAERRTRVNRALQSDVDAAIVEAWDPAVLGHDPRIPGEARQRIDLAIRRRRWVGRVRAALTSRDASHVSELLAEAPEDAFSQLSAVERRRIDRLIERASASANLEQALAAGSREAILDAMNRLMACGATLPESLDWAKVRDVADRESLVRAIRDATRGPRPDFDRLALLLPAARAAAADSPLLDDDIDVEELEQAVLREDHLRRLRAAMVASDDAAIAAAAGPDPFGALGSLTPEERAHINSVLRRLGRRELQAARTSS